MHQIYKYFPKNVEIFWKFPNSLYGKDYNLFSIALSVSLDATTFLRNNDLGEANIRELKLSTTSRITGFPEGIF